MKRFPVAFFFERLSWTEEIHANWNWEKKNVLVLRQWPDLYQFSKVSKRTNPLKLVKSGQFFFPCKLSNSRLRNNNEIFLIQLITRPCKYELSVRIEVVLNEAILHRSSSFFFFVTKYFCKFPIWRIIITHPC